MPLVLIATAPPISVGGFGVREGSFVALLADAGVSAADATLLSLLSAAVMVLASLPGGLALLIGYDRAGHRAARLTAPLPLRADAGLECCSGDPPDDDANRR